MSMGWSLWVMFLVTLNLGITFALYLWAPRAKIPVGPDGSTGHVWAHGVIREGMHKLPLWWVLFSGAMFLSGFTYLALYPGFGHFKGALDWTSHKQLAEDVAHNDAKRAALFERFKLYSVEQLASDPAALQMGKVLFEDNCAACHQRSGKGNLLLGAPNLTDEAWLYGGSGSDITTSIRDGRSGVMPPWSSLGEESVKNLTQYVLSLSGAPHDKAKAAAAEPTFAKIGRAHV